MDRIATDTVDDIAREMDAAWHALEQAVADAEPRWDDRILASEDPDESGWSPRFATWHAIAGELIRLSYHHHLLTDGPDSPPDMMAYAAGGSAPAIANDSLRAKYRATATVDEMRELVNATREESLQAIRAFDDSDLDRRALLSSFVHEYLREHGQEPSDTLRGSLLHGIVHMRDHASQIERGLVTGA